MKIDSFRILETEPKRIMAPCKPGGEVITTDYDTKEGLCKCKVVPNGCPVDGRNNVIQPR